MSESVPGEQHAEGDAADSFHANYFAVFIALCVCTLISVGIDLLTIQSKALLAVLVLAIAAAKAFLVVAYFMHLKFETGWKYVLLGPTVVLAIGLPLALYPDIGLHYYEASVKKSIAKQAESP